MKGTLHTKLSIEECRSRLESACKPPPTFMQWLMMLTKPSPTAEQIECKAAGNRFILSIVRNGWAIQQGRGSVYFQMTVRLSADADRGGTKIDFRPQSNISHFMAAIISVLVAILILMMTNPSARGEANEGLMVVLTMGAMCPFFFALILPLVKSDQETLAQFLKDTLMASEYYRQPLTE